MCVHTCTLCFTCGKFCQLYLFLPKVFLEGKLRRARLSAAVGSFTSVLKAYASVKKASGWGTSPRLMLQKAGLLLGEVWGGLLLGEGWGGLLLGEGWGGLLLGEGWGGLLLGEG